MDKFIPIIGIEVHIELKTKSKMFCSCPSHHFQVEPNTHTCPVCLGLPGALPVPNKKAVDWCLQIGAALNCKLNLNSKFDRKNYFYPDLAKGYQISQYDEPFCEDGGLNFILKGKEKTVGIERVHMEEDTGKLVHRVLNGEKVSLVDFNRSGVPLVEIVTKPDIRSADEAVKYLKTLQKLVRYLSVSDCDMEKGSMRCEVNLSLSKDINVFPKYKVEVKNINSFKFVKKAIFFEIKRQTEILNQARLPQQETRGFNEDKEATFLQRSKEEAQDYRYFPEPDIPPISWTKEKIKSCKNSLPELPREKRARFKKDYKLAMKNITFLTRDRNLADWFDNLAGLIFKNDKNFKTKDEKLKFLLKLANMIVNKKVEVKKLNPENLIAEVLKTKAQKITDKGQIEEAVLQVLKQNPKAAADFIKGRKTAVSFLIGQVMRQTKGKADPGLAGKIIIEKLSAKP
jgi:aspartyl-tRNA(Asn)/glutamyl-tRNA(Gln) amidotransferase subunit B